MSMQVNNLEQLLAWVKSSPCQFTVSSMSGGYVHVKFLVPCDERVKSTDPDQVYTDDNGVRWRKEYPEDRDALINRCYEDGFRDGRREYADVEGIELPEFYLNELDKPVGIVKEKSK